MSLLIILKLYENQTQYSIGDIMAEQIKINVGSALTELDDHLKIYPVHGRDLMVVFLKKS